MRRNGGKIRDYVLKKKGKTIGAYQSHKRTRSIYLTRDHLTRLPWTSVEMVRTQRASLIVSASHRPVGQC